MDTQKKSSISRLTREESNEVYSATRWRSAHSPLAASMDFRSFSSGRVNVALSLFLGLCLIVIFAADTSAQSSLKGTTPAGIAPGSSEGSYPLSGFETINPYSGNLNFSLPLLQVAGRGGMSIPVKLTINPKWLVKLDANSYGGSYYNYVEETWWNDWFNKDKGYGPGRLVGRRTGTGGGECPGVGWSYNNPSLTRLTFTTSDGTEIELIDQLHKGQPLSTGYCDPGPHGPSRGTVFVTADGTSATFISDSTIYDNLWAEETEKLYPSGVLMTKDGTHYRIDDGKISWQRDRHGNKFTFTYESGFDDGRITRIKDSLNREINFEYDVQDVAPYGLCDRISYKGFGGAPRIIRISYSSLSNVLRSGYSIQTGRQLFPNVYNVPSYPGGSTVGQFAEAQFNPEKVSAVWLPDGVRSYQLRYNSYGELAHIQLPTGGAIEYDWVDARLLGSGLVSGFDTYPGNEVYRRVAERRVYSNGSILENKKILGAPEWLSDFRGYVTEDQYGADHSFLGRVKHSYYGIRDRNQPLIVSNNSYGFYRSWRDGQEYKTDVYSDDGSTVLRTITNTWSQTAPNWYVGPSDHAPSNDAHLIETITTLVDSNQVSKRTFLYDGYNNQTDVHEYEFGTGAPGPLVRHTHIDYLSTNPVNGADYASASPNSSSIHLRGLPTRHSVYDATNVEKMRTTFEYDQYAQNTTHEPILGRSLISGLDSAFSTSYQTRGNVTASTSYLLDSSGTVIGSVSGHAQYDVAGNVVKTIDARGHETLFDYSDCYGVPDDEAQSNTSPSNLGSERGFAFPTTVTNAKGHVAYTQYDYYTGAPVNTEDANGVINSVFHNDALDRPTQVVRAVNDSSVKSQTTFSYDDTNRIVTTTGDLRNYNDNLLKSSTLYDGLGRGTETRQYESATAFIATTQSYDALGRVSQVSNPYRSGDSVVSTTTTFDALGRVLTVTTPDGAVINTYYNGSQVLVKDQAGRERMSQTNSLGQLTDVWEITTADDSTEVISFPNHSDAAAGYRTKYQYDVLGNLTLVTQRKGTTGTVQTRTFSYDSLSRLASATNPESGTIGYQYDGNGNLTQKTDARSVVTTYVYDELNRVTNRTYSEKSTGIPWAPAVTYAYDALGVGNSKGRLTSVSSSVSSTSYSGYDAMGKVTGSSQTTDGQTYTMSYGYNLAGALTSETYPSGRVVTTAYDDAGWLSTVTGQKTGEANKTYASSPSYAAHGAMKDLKLGNNLWEHTSFNTRLQPTEIALGTTQTGNDRLTLTYSYGTTSNNGNVQSQTITIPGGPTLTQTYTYDSLNRLKSAEEMNGSSQSWKQTFVYDRFGNRTFDSDPTKTTANALSSLLTIDPANNRFTTNQGSILYDNAGNLTREFNGHTFGYDGENKQVSYDGGSGAGGTDYKYDGDGKRIKKLTGTSQATTVFVYDAMGQMVAEYDTAGPQGAGGTSYLTSDTLGTPRIITDSSGAVIARHDYLPFGEEIGLSGGRTTGQGYAVDNVNQKFTLKERDNESGLDYFGARYYASGQGRFASCDAITATKNHVVNPQRWNAYGYVINNPLILFDPDGNQDEGKGGPKTIDVFLVFAAEARGQTDGRTNPQPPWKDLSNKNYQVRVFQQEDSTAANIRTSVANADVVVIIGDSQGDVGPDKFTATSISAYGNRLTDKGVEYYEPFAENASYAPKPEVNADVVCVITCNSVGLSNVFEFNNPDTVYVGNDGGRDGRTGANEAEWGGYNFVRALTTGATPEQAKNISNKALNQYEQNHPGNKHSDGDQLQTKRP